MAKAAKPPSSRRPPPPAQLAMWRAADAVCFAVNTTVIKDEGIDALARSLGKHKEVAGLTRKAMGGDISFQEALTQRLEIMRPTAAEIDAVVKAWDPEKLLSPGVADLIATLKARGTAVYLISGGFTQLVHPVADYLGLNRANVFANTLLFDPNGQYQGFDETAFTAQAGGKAQCVQALRQLHRFRTVVMVGDGHTDLEAKKPGAADMMVCYGGIVARNKVQMGADWFVTEFDELLDALRLDPHVVMRRWRGADAVCFDVDSTVMIDEGIDELAASLGKGKEVSEWTAKAMGGDMSFEDALSARLSIMRCSKAQLEACLASRDSEKLLSPGIAQLIKLLRARGTAVFLVSGGFTQMIHPVADHLGLPRSNVYANTIVFDERGKYVGFDQTAYTSKSGGKPRCIEALRQRHGFDTVVMIGDGATDLEARRPGAADLMIGYGGIQTRMKVKRGADWFVTSFDPLISALRPKPGL